VNTAIDNQILSVKKKRKKKKKNEPGAITEPEEQPQEEPHGREVTDEELKIRRLGEKEQQEQHRMNDAISEETRVFAKATLIKINEWKYHYRTHKGEHLTGELLKERQIMEAELTFRLARYRTICFHSDKRTAPTGFTYTHVCRTCGFQWEGNGGTDQSRTEYPAIATLAVASMTEYDKAMMRAVLGLTKWPFSHSKETLQLKMYRLSRGEAKKILAFFPKDIWFVITEY